MSAVSAAEQSGVEETVDRLRTLGIDQLAEVLGCSVRSIERQLAAFTFPIAPVQGLGCGLTRHPRRWSPFVVEDFLRQNGRVVTPGRREYFTSARQKGVA